MDLEREWKIVTSMFSGGIKLYNEAQRIHDMVREIKLSHEQGGGESEKEKKKQRHKGCLRELKEQY